MLKWKSLIFPGCYTAKLEVNKTSYDELMVEIVLVVLTLSGLPGYILEVESFG